MKSKEFETVAELAEASIETMEELPDQNRGKEFSAKRRALDVVDGLLARTTMTEFMFERLDNFKRLKKNAFGVLRQVFNRGVTAETQYSEIKKKTYDAALVHWEKIWDTKVRLEKLFGGKTFDIAGVPVTQAMKDIDRYQWTVERMVAFALNLGNQSSYDVVQKSFEYTDVQIQTLLSHFTRSELEAIQGIWDVTDTLFPELNAAHFRVYNRHLDKIEAREITVLNRDGEKVRLKGAHYPVQFDRRKRVNTRKSPTCLTVPKAYIEVPNPKTG
jgi:hypothetical protein